MREHYRPRMPIHVTMTSLETDAGRFAKCEFNQNNQNYENN